MALNYIFVGMFVIAFILALVKTFILGDLTVFENIVSELFDKAKLAVTLCLGLIGVMAFWLGIMKIGEKGGAIRIMARLVSPLFRRLFPEIPKDHPAMGSMMMNISANMLGLDNAATPLGLKAMKDLQEENPSDDTASNAQIMFLVLNTSGLTIIPASVLALRASTMAEQHPELGGSPTDIFLPILFATFFSTIVGLIAVGIKQRLRLYDPVVLAYLGGGTAIMVWAMYYLSGPGQEYVGVVAALGGNLLIFGIIIGFLLLAWRKKVDVFSSFIEGAKEGFKVAIKIIPYLVAMLVAIAVFRAAGAMEMLEQGLKFVVVSLGFERTEWVDAMPVAFMKPLSGGGARGAMVELWDSHPDGLRGFVGSLAAVMQGSTETTFYTLAVYFGAVNITKTRYTVWMGLLADLAGIIAAIVAAYIFFGDKLPST